MGKLRKLGKKIGRGIKKVGKRLKKGLGSIAKAFGKKGDTIPFNVDNRTIGLMKDEVGKYLGGKYNFIGVV